MSRSLQLPRPDSRAIAVVGDVMLDKYVLGAVDRISPEAPVPVLQVSEERLVPGGAANVASNIVALGSRANLHGIVGGDGYAADLRALLAELRVDTGGLAVDADRPTTVKTRLVALNQQIARVDLESKAPVDERTRRAMTDGIDRAITDCAAIVISDYGKGVVTRELVATLRARASEVGVPLLADPKSRDFSMYRGVDILTPNRAELAAAVRGTITSRAEVAAAARDVILRHGIANVLVTLGADGMMLASADDVFHLPTQSREVFDVSGAGDTVMATLALAVAGGCPLSDAVRLANAAAGIVVGKFGTATVSRDELHATLGLASRALTKLVDLESLLKELAQHRSRGHRIVFTNGCYDLLHAGHVSLLERSAAFGDVLVVGLNSDASIRRLKGPERPLNRLTDRAAVLGALESVRYVVSFEEDTPIGLIEAIRPDVITKGGDYTEGQIVGASFVKEYGGRVERIPLLAGRSTTATIGRIREEGP